MVTLVLREAAWETRLIRNCVHMLWLRPAERKKRQLAPRIEERVYLDLYMMGRCVEALLCCIGQLHKGPWSTCQDGPGTVLFCVHTLCEALWGGLI